MGKRTCKEPWGKEDKNARSVEIGNNCALLCIGCIVAVISDQPCSYFRPYVISTSIPGSLLFLSPKAPGNGKKDPRNVVAVIWEGQESKKSWGKK